LRDISATTCARICGSLKSALCRSWAVSIGIGTDGRFGAEAGDAPPEAALRLGAGAGTALDWAGTCGCGTDGEPLCARVGGGICRAGEAAGEWTDGELAFAPVMFSALAEVGGLECGESSEGEVLR
jgi:hypothetical protein